MIIFRWADGTECHPHQINQYQHMSDDYERVEVPLCYELGSGREFMRVYICDSLSAAASGRPEQLVVNARNDRVIPVSSLLGYTIVDFHVIPTMPGQPDRLIITLQAPIEIK